MHILDWSPSSSPRDFREAPDDRTFVKSFVYIIRGNVKRLEAEIDAGLDLEQTFYLYNLKFSRYSDLGPANWSGRWKESSDWVTFMHIAARFNKTEILKLLIQRGAVVDSVGYTGFNAICFTPLSEAVKFNHREAIDLLLDAGARVDYNTTDSEGRGLTFTADLLRRSLDARPFSLLGTREPEGFSPDRRKVFDLLLERGAAASLQDHKAHVPTVSRYRDENGLANAFELGLAIRYNQLDIVKELIDHGASCTQTLGAFVSNPAPNKDLLDLLITNGANDIEDAFDPIHIDGVDNASRFLPDTVKIRHWLPTVGQNRQRALNLILQHFTQFTKTSRASDVMLEAAIVEDIANMEVLLANGLSINCINSNGFAAIHMARHVDVVEWLLANKADVTTQAVRSEFWGDYHLGDTALHFAAQSHNLDRIDRLLRAGADVHATNGYGETPFLSLCRKAVIGGNGKMHGPIEELELLVHAGSDVTATDSNGKTALHLLVVEASGDSDRPERCEPVIEFLINRGVDASQRDRNGKLAVQYAAEYEQEHDDSLASLRPALERCTSDYAYVMQLMGQET